MRTAALAAGILSIMIPLGASGARFPNAVEKTITLTGDAAVSLARLMGLSAAAPSASLQLERHDAWAVYLLKQGTKGKLTSGDGPDRYNAVKFTNGGRASLSIAPYWLDLGTKAPQPQPGYYSFGSPFLPETLSSTDPWTQLVRRLRNEPGWNRGAAPQFQRCISAQDGTEICIRVYGNQDYANTVERNGYSVTITAHPSR